MVSTSCRSRAVSDRLWALTAGNPGPTPLAGLSSRRMGEVLGECAARFDWVLIDTPPVGVLPDAQVLARLVGEVILVIGAGSTPVAAIERAVAELGGPDAISGTVLNRVEERRIPDADYYDRLRNVAHSALILNRTPSVTLDSIPIRSGFRSGHVCQVYNEAAFRHFLAVERARAERSQRFFTWSLITIRQSTGRPRKDPGSHCGALSSGDWARRCARLTSSVGSGKARSRRPCSRKARSPLTAKRRP